MAPHIWWLYATTVFLISGTPGPNMLHVMVQSIQQGCARALASMAGLMSAVLLCLMASAAGLGALLKASPMLYTGIKYAGVAYLVWLGIKAWRAPVSVAKDDAVAPPRRLSTLYFTGVATGLSNPKLIIFAAALFPQFLDIHRPFATQLAVLIATFVVIEGFWYSVYALGGRSLAGWLAPAGRQRLFNRGSGLIFIGFGGVLLGSGA